MSFRLILMNETDIPAFKTDIQEAFQKGFEDVYEEENARSRSVIEQTQDQDDYYSYIADLTLQALDEAYAKSETNSNSVLRK